MHRRCTHGSSFLEALGTIDSYRQDISHAGRSRHVARAAGGWRLAAALVVLTVAVAAEQVWQAERRSAALRDEVAGLHAQLGDKRELIARQRREMAQVASAVDHLTRTTAFGARMSPCGEGREMHPGIDISARYGLPVTAAGSGEVAFAGHDPGYGGLVIVDHGGQLDTLYGHLSALYVREGQRVRGGQAIGAVGATGRATGAHLHYEVRVNGAPVDPRRYLMK